jgi:hypothetical protein
MNLKEYFKQRLLEQLEPPMNPVHAANYERAAQRQILSRAAESGKVLHPAFDNMHKLWVSIGSPDTNFRTSKYGTLHSAENWNHMFTNIATHARTNNIPESDLQRIRDTLMDWHLVRQTGGFDSLEWADTRKKYYFPNLMSNRYDDLKKDDQYVLRVNHGVPRHLYEPAIKHIDPLDPQFTTQAKDIKARIKKEMRL